MTSPTLSKLKAMILSVKRLHKELNEAMMKLRNSRREKDSEFLFFKNIVMHVGIGLIIFKEDGKIEIFNSAARKFLRSIALKMSMI